MRTVLAAAAIAAVLLAPAAARASGAAAPPLTAADRAGLAELAGLAHELRYGYPGEAARVARVRQLWSGLRAAYRPYAQPAPVAGASHGDAYTDMDAAVGLLASSSAYGSPALEDAAIVLEQRARGLAARADDALAAQQRRAALPAITADDRDALAELTRTAHALQSGIPGDPAGPLYDAAWKAANARVDRVQQLWVRARTAYQAFARPTLFAGQPRFSDGLSEMDEAVSLLETSASYGPAAIADAALALESRARVLAQRAQ
ncbi:hypothetical protein WPS_00780 [Vulcanimicrobium alpinum]|uniref:Uncharacterized protein n=1 Tax=Vulcanimicrobium alpinum TaxID=3016050 RepID=A0AAN1XRU0_UNVUL|nr:hypothetical protein [Vulcanimicrobium alpinum]BDE04802.1 hypothetical protein WPS_00780 [Vulcanimicrobium alpinum]